MSNEKSDELLELVRELVKWSKFAGKQELKKILVENLQRESDRLVYEHSDGERSSRDIEKTTGVGRASVQRDWDKWFKLGIVEESKKYQGRMKHICSLEELGIEPPSVPAQVSSSETTSNEPPEATSQ
ncbi:MAG: hypothetical protein JRN34_05000 [Nitrososphaerota archaeon]|nr:hypothetical protein [Nitrososphaerota archaeon]MDG6942266.1 hypothetical protein [Nitrososphaerota archaeon]MDG6942731.1 hypothetical protein [Nitrososphaerota archaeon]MDG6948518.1 hypothetical protein [Nitrososphaerota archaeon]MDG6950444.1 hypothetical protein [Nitrososphaerota archaeon]